VTALRVLAVAGCRPNFVKLGPLFAEMRRHPGVEPTLVHTGQHYDAQLSDVFFRDLELPAPDVALGIGSGSHAVQTAQVMERLEGVLLERRPDLVLVVGDVNSTVAAALTAVKLGIPVAHVEAGLRSGDREMPEEVNRLVTDAIADFLFASEPSAVANLEREGVPRERIHFVGNVMVDALLSHLERIASSRALAENRLDPRGYAVATLHRPENVDDPEHARELVGALVEIAARLPIVFPVHPRTRERLGRHGLWGPLERAAGLHLAPPLGYLDFLHLVHQSALVLTDSGGLQEETTVLGVACLTLRDSTERPATVELGTNRLVGRRRERIVAAAFEALAGVRGGGVLPELWDGGAARRVIEVLVANRRPIETLHRDLRRRTTCERNLSSVA